jgi:hypothetical protein
MIPLHSIAETADDPVVKRGLVFGSGLLVVGLLGPIGVAETTTARPEPASARTMMQRAVDERGVAGRNLRDVISAEQATARRSGTAASIDPALAEFANDPNAYLDTAGNLFIADFMPTHEHPEESLDLNEDVVAQGVAPPTASVFELNSKPGSTKTIYLDFDGETVSGTAWNASNNGGLPKTVPAFDRDGNPGSFSAAEQSDIRLFWQEVAEDFAPFDINVTTQRPASNDAFTKTSASDQTYGSFVVVTPDRWLCTGCAGVAYVNVIDRSTMYNAYAWVFPSVNASIANFGSVASHEVGHNFGLSHDGVVNGATYYSGAGTWGPIMGSTNRQFIQWSRGEYAGANQTQDDLAIIAAKTGYNVDTSSSVANAVTVPAGETVITADEVITSSGDVDVYAIDVVGGYLRLTLNRSSKGMNLVPRVRLLDAVGTVVATSTPFTINPTTVFDAAIPTGRYFAEITSAAAPNSDFSAYGSLGYYNLTLFRPDIPTTPTVSLSPTGDRAMTASWTPTTSSTPGAVISYRARSCDTSSVCSGWIDTSATSWAFSPAAPSGGYRVEVIGRTQFAQSSTALSPTVNVLSRPSTPILQRVIPNESAGTIRVTWARSEEYLPVAIANQRVTLRRVSSGETIAQTVAATATSFDFSVTPDWFAGPIEMSVVANTASSSPWDTSPVASGSVTLGRVAAPGSAAGSAPARGAAPTASNGGSNGRSAAPQA